jgi:hypothetical protein
VQLCGENALRKRHRELEETLACASQQIQPVFAGKYGTTGAAAYQARGEILS